MMMRSGAGRLSGLLRPQQDDRSITHVANLINASFANDPFIRWLRPGASPLSRSRSDSKFQYRRLQHAIADGVVFKSDAVSQLARTCRNESKINSHLEQELSKRLNSVSGDDLDDAGVALMLIPPERNVKWTRARIFLKCKLWLLDILKPAVDHGSDKSRNSTTLDSYYKVMDSIRLKFGIGDLWYLEVIAVHPLLQGMGMGKKAMQWLMEYIGDQTIALECTQEKNVEFYRKFGFEVFEVTTLQDSNSSDGGENGMLWWMVRRGPQGR